MPIMSQSDTIGNFRNISDGFSSLPPSTNANNIKQNGTWKAYEWTNTPNGHSIGILSAYYYDTGYGYQLFDDYYDGGLYRRQLVSDSFGAWQKLATESDISIKTLSKTVANTSTVSVPSNWRKLYITTNSPYFKPVIIITNGMGTGYFRAGGYGNPTDNCLETVYYNGSTLSGFTLFCNGGDNSSQVYFEVYYE